MALALAALLATAACSGPVGTPSEETRTAGAQSTAPAPTPGATSGSATPAAAGTPVQASDVVTGLEAPWGVLPLTDGTVLVSQRDTGSIVRVSAGRTTPVKTIDAVRPGGEGGLLGLAATPDRSTVFAYFTAADDNRIVAMSWDGSRLGAPETILDGLPKAGIHNGGGIIVGPDGYLYAGTGDAGQRQEAQRKDTLGGKILRLTLEGEPAPDNPFDDEIYSLGHRNVQGLAFDEDGRLWASEFGSQSWDELNLITKGANYGWPLVEGSGSGRGLTNPKVVWRTSEASPSGLAFWQGSLWMAALRGARLWEIPLDGADAGEPTAHLRGEYGRLRSVAVAEGGGSLLVGTSNTDGRGNVRDGDDRLLEVTR